MDQLRQVYERLATLEAENAKFRANARVDTTVSLVTKSDYEKLMVDVQGELEKSNGENGRRLIKEKYNAALERKNKSESMIARFQRKVQLEGLRMKLYMNQIEKWRAQEEAEKRAEQEHAAQKKAELEKTQQRKTAGKKVRDIRDASRGITAEEADRLLLEYQASLQRRITPPAVSRPVSSASNRSDSYVETIRGTPAPHPQYLSSASSPFDMSALSVGLLDDEAEEDNDTVDNGEEEQKEGDDRRVGSPVMM